MDNYHLIFVHETEGNIPAVINASYMLCAEVKDDSTCIVMYDFYDNTIYDSDIYVNESPAKLFTLVPQEDFVMLHLAEENASILVRIKGIISIMRHENSDVTTIDIIGGISYEVNETPMNIRETILSGKQRLAIKPRRKPSQKKEEPKA